MTQLFVNREFSLLEFNRRILNEASRKHHPLLERVKFLSLAANNLDEFFTVRLAGLDTENFIEDDINDIQTCQGQCWKDLQKLLVKEKISVLSMDKVTKDDRKFLEDFFNKNIFPILTPQSVTLENGFPFILNFGLSLVASLSHNHTGEKIIVLLRLPRNLPRFIALPNRDDEYSFVLSEEVISYFLPLLLLEHTVNHYGIFRVIRDSHIDIDEECPDFMEEVKSALERRRYGRIVRVEVLSDMSEELRNMVKKGLGIADNQLITLSYFLRLADIGEFLSIPRDDLKYQKLEPIVPSYLEKFKGDCFAAIQKRDRIVHHPYETFDVVVQFLRHATKDPNVIAIKQTLYRTSHDSPIVQALKDAAFAGKSVTAIVELKARFDEAANMRWAQDLEQAGVQVIFGFCDLKIHAKLSLIVRREGEDLCSYVHVGTGNYHPVTAKLYADISLFTCDKEIAQEVSAAFNYITSRIRPKQINIIALAPINLREKILQHIRHEKEAALNGKDCGIWMKMNALVDNEIIESLYDASQAGVPIKLIIRGICCLRPQVKGLSDNIEVKSIVGRFLEHSRIYCFANGSKLPSSDAVVYIGSADMMPRNLHRRVELLVPIRNKKVKKRLLSQIMLGNIFDKQQSYEILKNGKSRLIASGSKKQSFNAQEYFINPDEKLECDDFSLQSFTR